MLSHTSLGSAACIRQEVRTAPRIRAETIRYSYRYDVTRKVPAPWRRGEAFRGLVDEMRGGQAGGCSRGRVCRHEGGMAASRIVALPEAITTNVPPIAPLASHRWRALLLCNKCIVSGVFTASAPCVLAWTFRRVSSPHRRQAHSSSLGLINTAARRRREHTSLAYSSSSSSTWTPIFFCPGDCPPTSPHRGLSTA